MSNKMVRWEGGGGGGEERDGHFLPSSSILAGFLDKL